MMQSLIESVKFWFKNQAKRAAMTEEERYLSESLDLADFEARPAAACGQHGECRES